MLIVAELFRINAACSSVPIVSNFKLCSAMTGSKMPTKATCHERLRAFRKEYVESTYFHSDSQLPKAQILGNTGIRLPRKSPLSLQISRPIRSIPCGFFRMPKNFHSGTTGDISSHMHVPRKKIYCMFPGKIKTTPVDSDEVKWKESSIDVKTPTAVP